MLMNSTSRPPPTDHPAASKVRLKGLRYRSVSYVCAALDFVSLIGASVIGFTAYEYINFGAIPDPSAVIGIGLVFATVFGLALHSLQAYSPERIALLRFQIQQVLLVVPGTMAFVLTVTFFLKITEIYSRGGTLLTTILAFSALIIIRFFWHSYLPSARAANSFKHRNVLLICHEDYCIDSWRREAAASGMALSNILRMPMDEPPSMDILQRIRSIEASEIDEVVIAWRSADITNLDVYLAELRRTTLPVNVIFDGVVGRLTNASSARIGNLTAFQTQRPPLGVYELGLKRAFDIAFSSLALASLFPLLVLVGIAVKMDSPGPALFVQNRKGYGGRSFRIFKFRSMTVMENTGVIQQATRNDARVTRLGAFLRATSIDELPQFWNVIRGEMSIVGPRPHALSHDEFYDPQISKYAFRRHVKPGLTGWAQINNCRGETPTIGKMEERIFYDLWYINNWSFFLDIRIICKTARQMFDLRRAY